MKYALKQLTVPHRVISLTPDTEAEKLLFETLKEDKITTLKLQYFGGEITLLLPNACIRRWKEKLEKLGKAKEEIK